MSSAKYANNHNKLVSTRAGLTIGVFDTFQCTKTPTGDSANRSRNKQDFQVNHETKKLTLSGKQKTNLQHACHLLIFFPARRKSCP